MERHSCGERYFGEPSAWLEAVESNAQSIEQQLGIVGSLAYKNRLFLDVSQDVVQHTRTELRDTHYTKNQDLVWSMKQIDISGPIALSEAQEESPYLVVYARERIVSAPEKIFVPARILLAHKATVELARIEPYDADLSHPKLAIKTFTSPQEYFDIDTEDNINAFGQLIARLAVASEITLKLRDVDYLA